MPGGHSQSCVRTASMVRCHLWSEPESPPNRHDVALSPRRREAVPPPTGDALAQPMNRGRPMMISQPAIMCLNATWQRLTGRSARGAAPTAEQPLPEPALADLNQVGADVATESLLVSAAAGESESLAAEAREQRPARPARPDAPLPLAANERRARAAALRAMTLSRERRFAAAAAAFAEAARLDPVLDLTRTPAFWSLERAAHEAAIDAYAQAGRERDAAVLRARVQSTFRPKPLRPRPQATVSP
jgi:hypothetical protein